LVPVDPGADDRDEKVPGQGDHRGPQCPNR
jgi:hypothetical protein